jgi:hypothetical protein
MHRKSLWLSLTLVGIVVGCALTALVMLTQHVPSFYVRSAVPEGPQRKDVSKQFFGKSVSLIADIVNGGRPDTGNWGGEFSDAEVNCYFEEHFLQSGLAAKLLPDGVSEPRIAFEQDRIRLGFRYGTPPWSTIISIDFRVWLAKGEPNVIVLELKGLKAGALPISALSLLEEISDALRGHSVQVTWYRHEGNPTAALKFQTNQPRATVQVRHIELKPGTLLVMGHSNEPLPGGSGPPPVAISPTGN